MKPRGRAATIREVAELAGVSRMTVSRVINNEGRVLPDTRAAVEKAIESLNYSPNPIARALSRADRTTVALLHRFPHTGHLGNFLVHLIDETARVHAGLVVRKVSSSEQDQATVEQLASDGIDAVILTPPLGDDERLISLLRIKNMAVVAVGATRLDGQIPAVGIDERGAARLMTEHLLRIGHRRVGFIKGHPGHASSQLRLEGFRDAIQAAGLVVEDQLVAEGRYDYLSGLDAAEQLLDVPQPPTAIFASNDDMAAAVVAMAHRRGLDVPADLTVCGFDDSPLATTIWPPLTTIRQPIREIIRTAMGVLLQEKSGKGGEAARRSVVDASMIRRQSDASPRRRPKRRLSEA